MKIHKYQRTKRIIAVFFTLTVLFDVMFPPLAYALTSGPAQPEFTSFEPVVTTNMVNEFSGDLTYNLPVLQIPGPNGGGYALSLSYHSGSSPEEEASWVGAGWTLNPGAINRQMNGVPDDWNGTELVDYYNKTAPSTTASVGAYLAPEAFSWDVPVTASASMSYNNYRGFGYAIGAGVSAANGVVSLGFQVDQEGTSFSLAINPAALLNDKVKELKDDIKADKKKLKSEDDTDKKEAISNRIAANAKKLRKIERAPATAGQIGSSYLGYAINSGTFPMDMQSGKGKTFRLSVGGNLTFLPVEVGFQGNITGSYMHQETDETMTRNAVGYMYSELSDPSKVMDYHSENPTSFNKRDLNLPPAFNDHDQFMATGEGVVGAMRMHRRLAPVFKPALTTSNSNLFQLGIELNVGGSVGASADMNLGGWQELKMQGWDGASTQSMVDESNYLRMSGDMGGSIMYSGGPSEHRAHLFGGGMIGWQNIQYHDQQELNATPVNAGARTGRSSHIGYSLKSEYLLNNSYERRAITDIINGAYPSHLLDDNDHKHHVHEMSVLNETGQRYNYGLPVRSLSEQSLSYNHYVANTSSHSNRYLATYGGSNLENSAFKAGNQSTDPYATTYLLTSITDPDYIDRTNDGASDDDLGGWTKFKYKAHRYGSTAYKWRMPYEGYMYNPGELSECHDDRISFSEGSKEVYFLDEVITKSHRAVFHRSNRVDAKSPYGGPALQKLDKIELFALEDASNTPIKTVHFEYDYEVWKGLPNSSSPEDSNDEVAARLTLKKVWFEYNGTVPAMLAPYEFEYTYDLLYDYPLPYSATGPKPLGVATAASEPSYSPFDTDAWGNFCSDGQSRSANFLTWLDQSPTATFDPAAWQLKRIILPSGGEIHIQYEQDDYAYVQDRKAHAMVPFYNEPIQGDANTFKLDVSDLVSPSGVQGGFQASDIANQIWSYYNDDEERPIYFKIMYKLEDFNCDPGERSSEFISGYAPVEAVDYDNALETVSIKLKQQNHTLPYHVCKELFKTQKSGKNFNAACGPDNNPFPESHVEWGNDESMVVSALESFVDLIPAAWDFIQSVNDPSKCATICPEFSWFRVPIGERKLGGGLRVKRLLMVDPPVDPATATEYSRVFGTEYVYRTTDEMGRIISSGVATNEPAGLRDENVLVQPLERLKQSFFNRVVAGRDKKQLEGPLGQSMYPGAAVGYSKVIVLNIHSSVLENDDLKGKTAPAFAMQEFHTFKDYPVEVTDTDVQTKRDYFPGTGVVVNMVRNSVYASQGYTVHLPGMHGRPKKESTHSGDHRRFLGYNDVYTTTVSSTEYEYFDPRGLVPTLTKDWLPGDNFQQHPLGQEMDVSIEAREVRDEMDDGSLELEFAVGVFPPVISIGAMPTITHMLTRINSHTINKVVNYPAVVKRTKVYKDGIYHVSENLAFDQLTGDPVVTRTHDGFTPDVASTNDQPDLSVAGAGTYTSVKIPASMIYPDMGQAAKGEKYTLIGNCTTGLCIEVIAASGNDAAIRITASPLYAGSVCDALNAMCTGDLMQFSIGPDVYMYHLTGIDGSDLNLVLSDGSNPLTTPTTVYSLGSLRIMRSGCDNKLRETAGAYTIYGANSTVDNTIWDDRISIAQILTSLIPPAGTATDFSTENQLQFPNGFSCGPKRITLSSDADGTLRLSTIEPTCGPEDLGPSGYFDIDPQNGGLIFWPDGNTCFPKQINCLEFCDPIYPDIGIERVVACNATQYTDAWAYDPNDFGLPSSWYNPLNEFETGAGGRWRPVSQHAYMAPLDPGVYNFEQGMYTMQYFNWRDPVANNQDIWVRTDSITAYSPDGNSIEELDAMNRPSCAKYGYERMVPYLVAKNSRLAHVQFESFESAMGTCEECINVPNVQPDIAVAHAGSNSHRRVGSGSLYVSGGIQPITTTSNSGIRVLAWLRSTDASGFIDVDVSAYISESALPDIPISFHRVARTGEWELYEGVVQVPSNWTQWAKVIIASNAGSGVTTWIDDVRIQPIDAQMTTYVYDWRTLRLLATFDDQHFGMFYQYNGEGKLVRKLIETERGVRTITDSQSNTPTRLVHP